MQGQESSRPCNGLGVFFPGFLEVRRECVVAVFIAPHVLGLIDDWTKNGKFIWSGPFGNEVGGMAIFEGSQKDADQFAQNYGQICSGVLNYYVYKWDVLWGTK